MVVMQVQQQMDASTGYSQCNENLIWVCCRCMLLQVARPLQKHAAFVRLEASPQVVTHNPASLAGQQHVFNPHSWDSIPFDIAAAAVAFLPAPQTVISSPHPFAQNHIASIALLGHNAANGAASSPV
jgi:hypothetical protein